MSRPKSCISLMNSVGVHSWAPSSNRPLVTQPDLAFKWHTSTHLLTVSSAILRYVVHLPPEVHAQLYTIMTCYLQNIFNNSYWTLQYNKITVLHHMIDWCYNILPRSKWRSRFFCWCLTIRSLYVKLPGERNRFRRLSISNEMQYII